MIATERPRATEAKKREVTQLLREYRAFHSPFGGSLPAEDSHLRSADYGPGGYVEAGAYYDAIDSARLAESYEYLEYARTLLRIEDFDAWIGLSSPYTGSEADPNRVVRWRQTKDLYVSSAQFLERHNRAIEKLAEYLVNVDLYVVWPKRMTSQEERQIERRNDELFNLYEQFRYSDGMSRNGAIEEAAKHCGYSRSRSYEIVDVREDRTAG